MADAGGKDSGGGGTVTYADVKPIFMAKCTPCHSAGGAGASAHTLADSNADATKPAYTPECAGKKKGECTLIRIKNGSMPFGKGCSGDPTMDSTKSFCTTKAEQDKLQAWISGCLM